MTIRLNFVAHHVISPSQTAFMKGHNILEGVIILHETMHELHRKKKQNGVIFKIDFEKAYQALRMKGFSPKWTKWVETSISWGSVVVNVNEEIGHFFQTKTDSRQGDPLSPLLFNIVADMLAILINMAKLDGQIGGTVPHLIDRELSILQYADATILFLKHDLEMACNMKFSLAAFEKLSGLKINFHKGELYCFSNAQDDLD